MAPPKVTPSWNENAPSVTGQKSFSPLPLLASRSCPLPTSTASGGLPVPGCLNCMISCQVSVFVGKPLSKNPE